MRDGVTKALAEDLYGIKSLNKKDRDQLESLILDFFAAAFAGYRQSRSFNEAVEEIVFSQGGAEESYVLFQAKKYPARSAAFMNSVYGHGAELDDGNKKAAGHVGVHVIPAVFALADKIKPGYEDVLLAIAAGYEAYIRISSAAQPGMIQRGFHSTGMAGTLACAAAGAKLLNLDAQGIENAIALGTTMTGGLLSYGDSRPEIKPVNPGKAAENGVFAAMLAARGVEGPRNALEGPNGWFHAVSDSVDEDCLKSSDHLLIHDCYIKLYPSCRHTHCGIDAAIALHNDVSYNDIKEIVVHIYPSAIKLAGIPIPSTPDETKFSIKYTMACALMNGSYGIEDAAAPLKLTKEIIDLINKITLVEDSSMEDRKRGIRGTKVEAILNSGEVIGKTVLVPKGDPENPLTREDIINKLYVCSKWYNKEKVNELVDLITGADKAGTFIDPMVVLGDGQ